jgi:hypothetical protein
MIIVYLMKYQNMSLRDAHDLVKSKRNFIRPNLGFWKQLVDYERKLFGKNSIKLVNSSIGIIPDIYENEIKNMIWATPNGLVVTNSPTSGTTSTTIQNYKQPINNANLKQSSTSISLNPANTGVSNSNFAANSTVRPNRSYYQTTYSSSYCAKR